MLEASPATKLGFIVTGADKTKRYGAASEIRPASSGGQEPEPRPTLTVSRPPPPPTATVRSGRAQRRAEADERER